ncbi:AraC family transcriptional regulator ligand-binding domain-containing protein [Nocardia sp. NEAU-G5]|uniref:AraC family transcriptional regulator ligand-binding domain-containing protein n=1 Tax=Nocardia albiluteola TaxID=2842303 RepID=A0ABS6BC67_9NOCA|nr:AraC family transcriptional regulator [Nocardia albiluteola]MBU3067061.1 AraC family transcriptional regulator ligand-binding domain-containing protein [Nocardia albiluteola]
METVDHVLLFRFPLDVAGFADTVRHRLAQEAGAAEWALSSSTALLPGDRYLRLWELVEHELQNPDVAILAAQAYTPGQLGLIDYLFLTAPTVAAGCAATGDYSHVATTNLSFDVVQESDDEVTADLRLLHGDGRGRELAIQVALCGTVTKIRHGARAAIDPVRVWFRQPAPPRHAHLAEWFGTDRIEFGAESDRITYRATDLDAPLPTADPMLADILTHTAGAAPAPRVTTVAERLHQELARMLPDGNVSVDRAARRLLTSRRSLQRWLADEGTTWRAELDRARRAYHDDLYPAVANRTELARRLGYSDSRALDRAHRRWSATTPRPPRPVPPPIDTRNRARS